MLSRQVNNEIDFKALSRLIQGRNGSILAVVSYP